MLLDCQSVTEAYKHQVYQDGKIRARFFCWNRLHDVWCWISA